MYTNKTIAVAMSGGLDSSYVAMMYKELNAKVIGITGLIQDTPSAHQVVENAKAVCDFLKIEHHVLDLSKDFEAEVINYFKTSYQNGITPNPCVVCNRKIKWGKIKDFAINQLGADFFATGHYAKLSKTSDGYVLSRAKDEKKDQLYVLFNLTQKDLEQTLFPMGEKDKDEVKQTCIEKNLPCKNSKESQDICFIPHPDTAKKFLIREFGKMSGNFVDINSKKVIGKHEGFYQYTIGQRKGIGISAVEPLYVVDIDAKENIVFVGYKENLFNTELCVEKLNFQQENFRDREFKAMVKIRYNSPAKSATVKASDNNAQIVFDEEQSAITPGQAAVIYDMTNEYLIGGGWINKKI